MILKKFLLSAFVVFVFFGYALHDNLGRLVGRDDAPPVIAPNTKTSPQAVPTSSPSSQTSGASPTPTATGQYKDGVYVGSAVDVFYGNVQVEAVISGGKITDVKFLDYPKDRDTSIEISNQAMPLLTAQAIQVQSAQVDGVSGASQTTRGFINSLQSALLQART